MSCAPITLWHGPRFLLPNGRWTHRLASRGPLLVRPGTPDPPLPFRLPEGYALPGFIDSHAHLALPGHRPDSLELSTSLTRDALAKLLTERARALPPGSWIEGGGWQIIEGEPSLPHHALLTQLCPEHPVALRRYDEHALWVNARALELARINENTSEPTGGRILRDAHGRPTGTLVDAAMEAVEALIPPPDPEAIDALILRNARHALAHGVTCLHDMAVSAPTLASLSRLSEHKQLPLRVRAYLYAADAGLESAMHSAAPEPRPELFAARGLKLFSDGALGSRGARLSRPYSDGSRGVQPDSDEHIARVIAIALEQGWQVAVHAIGDAAVHEMATRLAEHTPGPRARWRIEHAQLLQPHTASIMARGGLAAAVQPVHATHDLPWAQDSLPPDILTLAYPWKTLLDAGIPIGLGTDFPIEPIDPLRTLMAATLREHEGLPLPGQAQRLTRAQALDAHWRGAAWLAFDERWLGALSPGHLCDFVVWDTDLTSAPPSAVLEAKVRAVVVDGEIRHEA